MIVHRLLAALCLAAGHAWGQANPVFSPISAIPSSWIGQRKNLRRPEIG
jgi:hypothetical protein